jgi:hypothetical protein
MASTESVGGPNAALITEVREVFSRDYEVTPRLRDELSVAIADVTLSEEIRRTYQRQGKLTTELAVRICAALAQGDAGRNV